METGSTIVDLFPFEGTKFIGGGFSRGLSPLIPLIEMASDDHLNFWFGVVSVFNRLICDVSRDVRDNPLFLKSKN